MVGGGDRTKFRRVQAKFRSALEDRLGEAIPGDGIGAHARYVPHAAKPFACAAVKIVCLCAAVKIVVMAYATSLAAVGLPV
jgi:hypothetical protein